MKLKRCGVAVLICSFYYCIQMVFADAPDIAKPLVQQFANGGIKLTIQDLNHVFNYVHAQMVLQCDAKRMQLESPLEFQTTVKRWTYENLNIPYCNEGSLNYKILAIRGIETKELLGTVHFVSKPVKKQTQQSVEKDGAPLLGLTSGLLGGVNLNLLGLQVSNGSAKHEVPQSSASSNEVQIIHRSPDANDEVVTSDTKCTWSKTTINNNQKVCRGELIFEDNFDGEMNWTKWSHDIRIPLDSEDLDFVSFQDHAQNLYIKNGQLHVLPKLLTEYSGFTETEIRTGTLDLGINCTGIIDRNYECKRVAMQSVILPPVVSARIRTKSFFSFKYGVIEVRAKLPKGDWLFPQMFLESATNEYGVSGYASGQIRMAFIRGNEVLETSTGRQIDGYRLYGGVVLAQGEEFRELWMKSALKRRNHFADDYHVYKTIWSEDSISFYVDGTEYGSLMGNFAYEAYDVQRIEHAKFWKTGDKMAPFDTEFYLSFGVSAGGISDFPDNSTSGRREIDTKPWSNYEAKNELNFWKARDRWHSTWVGENAALQVDYVKVWAL